MERCEERRFTITPFRDARKTRHSFPTADQKKQSLPAEIAAAISCPFDKHLERLAALKAQLDIECVPEQPTPKKKPYPDILPSTLIAMERMTNVPLLPPPKQPPFEEAFQRFEPMFHTVFYRRYHPMVRDDMKQVGLIALYKKWKKDPTFLENTPAYVVTAAVFGAGNWRQKQMKVGRRETKMQIDGHDKVIGATQAQREHDSWMHPIDRRIDVELAQLAVLFQYPNNPQKEWTTSIITQLKLGRKRILPSLSNRSQKREFQILKAQVIYNLQEQLKEYGPISKSRVVFDAASSSPYCFGGK